MLILRWLWILIKQVTLDFVWSAQCWLTKATITPQSNKLIVANLEELSATRQEIRRVFCISIIVITAQLSLLVATAREIRCEKLGVRSHSCQVCRGGDIAISTCKIQALSELFLKAFSRHWVVVHASCALGCFHNHSFFLALFVKDHSFKCDSTFLLLTYLYIVVLDLELIIVIWERVLIVTVQWSDVVIFCLYSAFRVELLNL